MQKTEEKPLIATAFELFAMAPKSLTPREIACEMEPKVSPEWVRKFVKGEIPNPGVLTLEAFIKAMKKLTNV